MEPRCAKSGRTRLFDPLEDLGEGESGRVDDDGVRGRVERRVGAAAVPLVALAQLAKHYRLPRCRRGHHAIAGVLLVAPLAPRFGRGVKKDLHVGIRKNNGADVAPFHHDAAPATEFSLQIDHPGAYAGVDAHPRSALGHIGITDALRDVLPIEKNTIRGAVGLEADLGVARQPLERARIVEILVALDRLQGEGAIHGAGFQIQQTEVMGEMARDSALARAGGAVDGDDRAASHSGVSS